MRIDIEKIMDHVRNARDGVVLGIDGYVDEVWQIIEARRSAAEYTVCNQMRGLGERILRCGKGGMANEIVRKRISYGGFTGNTGNAIAALGVRPTMLGMYGKPAIHPVFEPFAESARLISLGSPAICHIFEFEDGKIMFPYMEEMFSLRWDTLANALSTETLTSVFAEAGIVALGYWTNLHAFDDLVCQIADLLPDRLKCRMFFDLADINKRDEASLVKSLAVLKELGRTLPMTLSLNEHEAALLFARHGVDFPTEAGAAEQATADMQKLLGLDEILVHTPYFATIATASEGSASVRQFTCERPVKTTGAGDTFNGGYLVSLRGGLHLRERLALANAATGFYVETGAAPRPVDLATKLELYRAQP